MIDIESLSNGPERKCILSIAAVYFEDPWLSKTEPDYNTLVETGFDSIIDGDQPNNKIDYKTVLWWMSQSQEAREAVFFSEKKVTLSVAKRDFAKWIKEKGITDVWSKPSQYDIQTLADEYNGYPPWRRRSEWDMRTVVKASKIASSQMIEPKIPHIAIHDAATQAVNLWRAINELRKIL